MKKIIKDVLLWQEGYLFLYQGVQKQFDYLAEKLNSSQDSVKNFNDNIENIVHYCNSKSIVYKHVIFPSKPFINTSFLP